MAIQNKIQWLKKAYHLLMNEVNESEVKTLYKKQAVLIQFILIRGGNLKNLKSRETKYLMKHEKFDFCISSNIHIILRNTK